MFNINQFYAIYRETLQGVGETDALVRLSLLPVPAKRLRVISHLAAENTTSDFDTIRIGIRNRGVDYYLDELQDVAADELCVSRSEILLGDGDSLFVEFAGTTTGDALQMTVSGWEMLLDD